MLGIAAVFVFVYVLRPATYTLLDFANLIFHEAGHVIFAIFGEWLGFLGGSLLQVLIPLVCAAYFRRSGQRFSSAVTLLWAAQSIFNVSVYVGDARAMQLELIGGEHDWYYLLATTGLLAHDKLLARLVYTLGLGLYGFALWLGVKTVWVPEAT